MKNFNKYTTEIERRLKGGPSESKAQRRGPCVDWVREHEEMLCDALRSGLRPGTIARIICEASGGAMKLRTFSRLLRGLAKRMKSKKGKPEEHPDAPSEREATWKTTPFNRVLRGLAKRIKPKKRKPKQHRDVLSEREATWKTASPNE